MAHLFLTAFKKKKKLLFFSPTIYLLMVQHSTHKNRVNFEFRYCCGEILVRLPTTKFPHADEIKLYLSVLVCQRAAGLGFVQKTCGIMCPKWRQNIDKIINHWKYLEIYMSCQLCVNKYFCLPSHSGKMKSVVMFGLNYTPGRFNCLLDLSLRNCYKTPITGVQIDLIWGVIYENNKIHCKTVFNNSLGLWDLRHVFSSLPVVISTVYSFLLNTDNKRVASLTLTGAAN